MPTQRFLKLKEEKKQAILEAAVHEFSRVPYSSASINQIIKEADISRGSFYTYFEDKDDLMRYMLRGFRDNCQERIFRTLKEQEGNPFETALKLLEAVDAGYVLGGKKKKEEIEGKIGRTEDAMKKLVDEATAKAEAVKKEKILEAKEEILRQKTETEKELRERRNETQRTGPAP